MKSIPAFLLLILLSFIASAQPGDAVPDDSFTFSGNENSGIINLNWTAAPDTNIHHFDIQRSNDGSNFISIGIAPIPGNPGNPSFSFDDQQPAIGKNYYRLVSVGVDESKKYSTIIFIDTRQAEKTDFVLTPNPSHTKSTISITGILKGKTVIIMYDLNGSKVAELYSGELNSNAFSTTFSVANLKKGIYIVSVHIGNQYTRKQLVVE